MTQSRPAAWTILNLLRWTTGYFQDKGVAEPRASAEVLLAHVLGITRLDLYLRHDQPLSPEELAHFKELIIRRRRGEPVAYLTGHKEFWSLDFLVTPQVLIPRPETEVLVEAAVKLCGGGEKGPKAPLPSPRPLSPTPPWGLELGVGSGAVVVSLARELPEFLWVAVDLSGAALRVAQSNARRHGVAERIFFLQGDLLSMLSPGPHFTLLVANLPYVATTEWQELPPDIRDYEPPEALLAGPDGLALLRPLTQEAHRYLKPGAGLALEVGHTQAKTVLSMLADTQTYENLSIIKDYSGLERVVLAQKQKLLS